MFRAFRARNTNLRVSSPEISYAFVSSSWEHPERCSNGFRLLAPSRGMHTPQLRLQGTGDNFGQNRANCFKKGILSLGGPLLPSTYDLKCTDRQLTFV